MSGSEVELPRRILLVDDEKPFCLALAFALRRRGHEVVIAHSVCEGRAEAAAWRPDWAVIDLRLGDGSGLELVEEFTSARNPIECVMLTGYGSIAGAVEAVKLGAVQYLTKPVSSSELLAAFAGQAKQELASAPSLEVVEWEHLSRVLSESGGNISEAARRLGMHRRTLQRKLAKGRGQ